MRLDERPVVIAALGALFIASSGVLVRLAASAPVTVAFYRCLYALPILGLVTYLEKRRFGALPQRTRNLAWVAGVFFA
ncbi:MAG: EamA/RhaT family transporter, partial [Actinomycetota bacterium]|nr:EamA/RhaT family transporter [Actinomycetota bacterium]